MYLVHRGLFVIIILKMFSSDITEALIKVVIKMKIRVVGGEYLHSNQNCFLITSNINIMADDDWS